MADVADDDLRALQPDQQAFSAVRAVIVSVCCLVCFEDTPSRLVCMWRAALF